MDFILLENIKVFANHGYFEEEKKMGNRFEVNLKLGLDLKKAGDTDKLSDTFNYKEANDIILEEMDKPSDLLENVAKRILKQLLASNEMIEYAQVKVSKLNPPLTGNIKAVSIVMEMEKKV